MLMSLIRYQKEKPLSLLLPNSHLKLTIPVKGFTRLKPSVPVDRVILDKKINVGVDDTFKKKDLQLQKAIDYADEL